MNKWSYDSKNLKITKTKNNITIINKKTKAKINILNIWEKAGTEAEAEEEKEIKYNYNADIEKKQLTIFDFI